MGYHNRDVEVAFLNEEECLVAACDSCGAIGSKELDVVKVPPYITGRFTARVALLEVVSVGAVPQIITVAVSNEPDPTGAEILEGVRDELRAFELSSLRMAISTEKNMPTQQTALGISIVGVCLKSKLRIATSQAGDIVYCLGLPKVGPEVKSPDDLEIVQARDVRYLLKQEGVHDIIPVGSKGIRAEVELLASGLNYTFVAESSNSLPIDLDKSAGPSTCLIFTALPEMGAWDFAPTPLFKIGRIR